MSWTPTEEFLHGRIIKPFLPFDKHPSLKNDNFRNLYPGDEVFVFETKLSKWARGYSLTRPFPSDFTITSVNLDELPGLNRKIVVFPLKYMKVVEKVPLNMINAADDFNNVHQSNNMAPTLRETEQYVENATTDPDEVIGANGSNGHGTGRKVQPPPLPFETFTFANDLVEEITYTLNLLTSHIYAMYSIGEFRLFQKLTLLYVDLDETRVKLTHGDLTRNEIQFTEETANHLLSTIPKLLASKAARVNEKSYDLDNKGTDVNGYKAILARDAFNGDLLDSRNSTPSIMALYQQYCALLPKFPINAHNKRADYLLDATPNKKLTHGSPSHILVDFKSVSGSSQYQPPGFAGMIAYMYVRNTQRRLTEAFAVHTDTVDELVFVEKISAALFRNIPASEVENNRVYLVAVLVEQLDLPIKEGSSSKINRINKGVAAGVTDITRIFSRNLGSLTSGESHQFAINLFGSHVSHKRHVDSSKIENNGWGELVDRIIKGSNHGIAVNPRAEKLVVTVKEFRHQLADDSLDEENFHSSKVDASMKTAPIAKIKPIFYDPLAENYERIYLKMGKVSLLNPVNKDDLLTFEVSAPNNDTITFAKASNQIEKRSWQFVSVATHEVIGEIVKVNGISFKNHNRKAPKQDALHLALYVNGVLAGEADIMYKSGNRLVEFNKQGTQNIDVVSIGTKKTLAQLDIHTTYIGKIFNTEIAIDNLFQNNRFFVGTQAGLNDLTQTLLDFCKLDIASLVKFFSESLTRLFEIIERCLGATDGLNYEIVLATTFKALVHLLDTNFGKRDQYLFMFDTFLEDYQKSPKIGLFLLERMAEVFSLAETNWNAMSRSVCRVLVLLTRLALDPSTIVSDKSQFLEYINTLFVSASRFLQLQAPALINDQILVMELVDFVMAFESTFEDGKLLALVIRFIDSISFRGLGVDDESINSKKTTAILKDHRFVMTKLLVIYRLFSSNMPRDIQHLNFLISRSVTWCMEIFTGPIDVDASRIACSIMNCVCNMITNNLHRDEVKQIAMTLSKFIFPMSRTFIRFNKFTRSHNFFQPRKAFTPIFSGTYPFKEIFLDSVVPEEVVVEILIELAAVIAYICQIEKTVTSEDGYHHFLNLDDDSFFDSSKYLSKNGWNENVLTVLQAIALMRQGKFFPEDKWLSFYGTIAESSLLCFEMLKPLLVTTAIPGIDNPELFDRSIWGSYLKGLLKLATLQPVSIEHLSTIPRKACHQITGDMRDRIADIINEVWDALAWTATENDIVRFNLTKFGGYQVEFINSDYGILQDLMLFALQRNQACQIVSIKILWSILVSEHVLSNSIVDVEKECLTGLYNIYYRNAYKPGLPEQNSFVERMKTTIRLDREDVAYPFVVRFISHISGFLAVLNDYNSVPVGAEFEDDRTFHKLNINAYLKQANRPELFHSFINQMYEDNLKKKDFVQAALSLELLSSTYEWDHYLIQPASYRPKFPEQSSFDRKESLVKLIAHNYVKGDSLERAIDVYNELLEAYSEHTYDLKSFAFVHNKLAKLYLDLESSDKLSPSYFRVAFIGAGFPANIRGKDQILEGQPFEHITSVHERMLKMYPGARIVTDDDQARELRSKNQTGRYLHINVVEPVYEISDKLLNTSIGVRQYVKNKDLRYFSSLKKLSGATSVFDLWTEEVTYETSLSFPTLMNRSDVKKTNVVRLSPLENAIRSIMAKNDDLLQLESMINIAVKEKVDYASLLSDLSRHLAGTVDSPVNGGVGQYRAFFEDTRYAGKPQFADSVRLLRNAFNDLTLVLSRCLHLHGVLILPMMKASQNVLVESFRQNFRDEIANLKIDTNYDAQNYEFSGNTHTRDRQVSDKPGNLSTYGASLQRSVSRLSSAASNSTDPSLLNSYSSSQNGPGSNQKRTALNWRNVAR